MPSMLSSSTCFTFFVPTLLFCAAVPCDHDARIIATATPVSTILCAFIKASVTELGRRSLSHRTIRLSYCSVKTSLLLASQHRLPREHQSSELFPAIFCLRFMRRD